MFHPASASRPTLFTRTTLLLNRAVVDAGCPFLIELQKHCQIRVALERYASDERHLWCSVVMNCRDSAPGRYVSTARAHQELPKQRLQLAFVSKCLLERAVLTNIETDPVMLSGMRNGDRFAWEKFLETFLPPIVEWLRSKRAPDDVALDLAHEILLKIYQRLEKYDSSKGRFRPWLATVIRNTFIDYRRKRRRDPLYPTTGDHLVEWLASPATADALATQLDEYVEPELSDALERARKRVKPQSWDVFVQTVINGRSTSDVAKELQMTAAAVCMAKYRLVQIIQQEYGSRRPGSDGVNDAEPMP